MHPQDNLYIHVVRGPAVVGEVYDLLAVWFACSHTIPAIYSKEAL
jgi:hypothetical protein